MTPAPVHFPSQSNRPLSHNCDPIPPYVGEWFELWKVDDAPRIRGVTCSTVAHELRTNTLTLSREEVHTLIMQAAWQIGSLSDDGTFREWHFELEVSEFGLVLIREAKDPLSHVEANWIKGTTVKTISYVFYFNASLTLMLNAVHLISRLLASSPDVQGEVRCNGYRLLRKARRVTHNWMRKIVDAVDDDQTSELQRRACDLAASCRATFDVEDGIHLDALLCSSADVVIAIENGLRH